MHFKVIKLDLLSKINKNNGQSLRPKLQTYFKTIFNRIDKNIFLITIYLIIIAISIIPFLFFAN